MSGIQGTRQTRFQSLAATFANLSLTIPPNLPMEQTVRWLISGGIQMRLVTTLLTFLITAMFGASAFGQTYGVELHNSLMPASSGMAGTSFSQPQDVQSAIYGNPATMTQFEGTQFSFGGGWAEPTINVDQTASLPLLGITPFKAKSNAPGSALGNIGIIHGTNVMGRPVKMGIGFMSNAGLAVDYRPNPESNGTHASLLALDVVSSIGMQVSDRLSIGGAFHLGTGIMDGPFASSSSSQTDYAGRGSLGMNFALSPGVTLGAYYQTKKSHTFGDIVRFPGGSFQDLKVDLPSNVGFGIANRNLMNGRLLLATDILFKGYGDAETFSSIYDDQWVLQFGTQYMVSQRLRARLGYAYNTNPMLDTVPGTIGGVIPVGGVPAVQYVQGQFAALPQHRLTGGVGVRDIMQNVDLDLSIGGMFANDQAFGNTLVNVKSYWFAFGLTWRYGSDGAGDCCSAAFDSNSVSMR